VDRLGLGLGLLAGHEAGGRLPPPAAVSGAVTSRREGGRSSFEAARTPAQLVTAGCDARRHLGMTAAQRVRVLTS
jgi:hypothetical protein